jgi:hypothetical protein
MGKKFKEMQFAATKERQLIWQPKFAPIPHPKKEIGLLWQDIYIEL